MKKKQEVICFLVGTAGKIKIHIALMIVIQIAYGISSIYYALFLHDIVNAATDHKFDEFFFRIVCFGVLASVQLILRAIQRYLDEYTKSSLENCFKKRLFNKLLWKDYAFVMSRHSGEWMNRLTNDTVVVSNGMSEILPGISGMAVRICSAVIVITKLEIRFLYLIIPSSILLFVFSTAFRKIMKKMHKQIQEQDGKLRMFLQETLGSLLIVHSYAVENDVLTNAEEKMNAHKLARMKRNHFSNFCNLGFGVIMNGAYVFGVTFCGYGILTGTMSYGTFVAVFQLIGQIQSPVANISGYLPKFYAMLASAERLMEVESFDNKYSKGLKEDEVICDFYKNRFISIGLSNVSFTYLPLVQKIDGKQRNKQKTLVLSNINMEINKGEYIAFMGLSGCGKSTVLKLLMCLYQIDKGERYLISTNKKEPLDASWQKLFAYVPQGNYLMSGSIREIVTFADKKKMKEDEKIWQALTIACADEFVYGMDQGIDEMLGERGMGLSEGQMQRLAIARAVFSEHPILMLDECTSALDEETEENLLVNLRNMTDKTVLIVTHRPAVLKICDRTVTFTQNGCKLREVRRNDVK